MTGQEIVDAVAAEWSVPVATVRAHVNEQHVVCARAAAMYLLRSRMLWSLPRIGKFLGGFHHTTVLYQLEKHERRLRRDTEYRARLDILVRKFPLPAAGVQTEWTDANVSIGSILRRLATQERMLEGALEKVRLSRRSIEAHSALMVVDDTESGSSSAPVLECAS